MCFFSMFPLTKCFILLGSFYGISARLKSFDIITLSNAFASLYSLICNVVVLSYYVCSIIILCSLFIPTVIIGLRSFIDIQCKILLCFVKYSCFRSFYLPFVKSYVC